MAMSINTNSVAITAQRNIGSANMRSSSSLAKLSSGSRVPSAKDDVAALAVGTKLKAEVAGLRQAQQNVGQGVSLLQIADGAMNTISDMLTRMKSLAVQSTSGQLTDSDRTLLNNEYAALGAEIDRVAADTAFNGTALLSAGTTVSSDINNTGAANDIGEGFEAINFSDSFGAGAIKVDFTAATNVMTVTNLENGSAQSIDIGGTAITTGNTQTVNFGSLGVDITLNSNFDKTTNIASTNTNANADIEAGTIELTGVTSVDGANAFNFGDVDSVTIATDTTAANAAFFSVTLNGTAFSSNTGGGSGTEDLTAVGTKNVTMEDANGNQIRFSFVVDTAVGNGDGTDFTLNELGHVIGANEVTGTPTAFTFKVGTGTTGNDDISVTIGASNYQTLSGSTLGNVSTAAAAATEMGNIDSAITSITSNRATVGAAQSRLEFAGASLAVATENTLSAQSAMLDVDVSSEMTEFTSSQVLLQAGISMLAQANQQPALLLRLLQ